MLGVLETTYLAFWKSTAQKVIVIVVKLGVKARGGSGQCKGRG